MGHVIHRRLSLVRICSMFEDGFLPFMIHGRNASDRPLQMIHVIWRIVLNENGCAAERRLRHKRKPALVFSNQRRFALEQGAEFGSAIRLWICAGLIPLKGWWMK
ncbi:hypothetical protein [Desulfatiglans anilini]|uniref:hypothetical protein n=1 Tax=Desulfatiglans anilini TaxID=90728 RepID=UPI00047F21CB|nr:hypothetical protein [Desulfatiglans anilini]